MEDPTRELEREESKLSHDNQAGCIDAPLNPSKGSVIEFHANTFALASVIHSTVCLIASRKGVME